MIIELAIASALATDTIPTCQPVTDPASNVRYVTTPCAAIGTDGTVTIVVEASSPKATPTACPQSECGSRWTEQDSKDAKQIALIVGGVCVAIVLGCRAVSH